MVLELLGPVQLRLACQSIPEHCCLDVQVAPEFLPTEHHIFVYIQDHITPRRNTGGNKLAIGSEVNLEGPKWQLRKNPRRQVGRTGRSILGST